MEYDFKSNNNLEERLRQFDAIKKEYPNRIPIILERLYNSSLNSNIKSKYILSNDLTMAEFMNIIREKLKISPETALFFLAKGKYNLTGNEILGEIYDKYKDNEDGFLYIFYSEEEIYG